MLHSRRRRLNAQSEAEAQGQSFWTKDFSEKVRTRLWHALDDASHTSLEVVVGRARHLVMSDEGLLFLANPAVGSMQDFWASWFGCEADMMPTLVEAAHQGMVWALQEVPLRSIEPASFISSVNEILNEHRISYELVGARMIEFESKEMHQAVVEPTLQLLAGRSDLASVETAYQKALKEISKGDPADAVTDAGTALQEMLIALGCEGNRLDRLLASARNKGLLAGHDVALVSKLVDWVAADRSTTGDTHNAAPALRSDAWLTVHIVGALILRLAGGESRPHR